MQKLKNYGSFMQNNHKQTIRDIVFIKTSRFVTKIRTNDYVYLEILNISINTTPLVEFSRFVDTLTAFTCGINH